MELLFNAHHIREMDFRGFASHWEIIFPKCANLLNLTDQNWTFCTNLQKKHCCGEQIFLVGMELLNNTHHIRQMDFADLPQIWKYSIQNVLIC